MKLAALPSNRHCSAGLTKVLVFALVQGAASHDPRICILLAPDVGEVGPCVLQYYKGKVSEKPKGTLSIRDAHSVRKLGMLSELFESWRVCVTAIMQLSMKLTV